MEDALSSDAAKTMALTAKLARDLQAAITGNLPKNRVVSDSNSAPSSPHFGSVYFGPLRQFAGGDPHFGMANGGLRSGKSPEVPFSPITTKIPTGHHQQWSMQLPAGTLPSRVSQGVRPMKPSYVLLFITIPISRRHIRRLMDADEMHFVTRLPDEFLEKARTILASR